MRNDGAFPGWCALCRRAGVTAAAVGAVLLVGPASSARPAEPAPVTVRLSAGDADNGLARPDWTLPDPVEQRRELVVLQQREQARRAATAAPLPPASVTVPRGLPTPAASTSAPAAPGTGPTTLGSGTTLSAPQAVSVAIEFALSQLGKPYVWGATGPDSYDCSGLVQTSYAAAGVALPRTSRQMARVGVPIALADLLPGDLVFWAHDPGDLSTVHHVAMYLGDGKVVQSPQTGDVVKVSTLWLSGYAGAVRVAAGVADTPLPTTPVAAPGPGVTPAGDEGVPDGPPVPVRPLPARPLVPAATNPTPRPGGTAPVPTAPGTTAPGTPAPGTPAPGTTAPGTTAPGTTAPGTTAPGTTAPGATAPGTSTPPTPDTASPGTSEPAPASPGTTAPGTTTPAPGTTAPTTPAPTTPPPAPSTPAPEPTTPAPTTPAPTTPAATTPPPTTPPPTPAGTSPDSTAPAATP